MASLAGQIVELQFLLRLLTVRNVFERLRKSQATMTNLKVDVCKKEKFPARTHTSTHQR